MTDDWLSVALLRVAQIVTILLLITAVGWFIVDEVERGVPDLIVATVFAVMLEAIRKLTKEAE